MKEEDIKESIITLLNNNQININNVLSIIVEYVKQVKNINITIEQLESCKNAFGIDQMLNAAVEFFKKKLFIVSLYSADGNFIKAF